MGGLEFLTDQTKIVYQHYLAKAGKNIDEANKFRDLVHRTMDYCRWSRGRKIVIMSINIVCGEGLHTISNRDVCGPISANM